MAGTKVSTHRSKVPAIRFVLYSLLLLLPSVFSTFTADPTDIKILLVSLSVIAVIVLATVEICSTQRILIRCTALDLAVLSFLAWNVIMGLAARYHWASMAEVLRLMSYISIYAAVSYLGPVNDLQGERMAGSQSADKDAQHKATSRKSEKSRTSAQSCLDGGEKKFGGTFVTLIVSSVLPCLYAAVQRTGLDPLHWAYPSNERVLATFGNPTYFAAYLVLIIPLTFLVFLTCRCVIIGGLYLLLMALQHACLLWTWSRGPWLGLIIGLFVGFAVPILVYRREAFLKKYGAKMAIGLGVLALVTFLVSAKGGLVERAASAVRVDDPSNIQRALQWKAGWAVFKEHPVTGVGPGNLRVHMAEKLTPAFFRTGIATASEHAHNEFIEIGAETGVVGLALFVIILGLSLYAAARVSLRDGQIPGFTTWVLVGGVLGFLFCNMVGVAMRYSTGAVYFWLFVGMIGATCRDSCSCWTAKKQVSIRRISRFVVFAIVLLGVLAVGSALCPFISSIYQRQGDIFFAQGEMEKAEAPYLKSLRFSPNNVSSMYNLAIVYTATDRYAEAFEMYERLGRLWPDIGRIHFNLGTLYAAEGDFERARAELERAAAIDGLPDTWAHLARILMVLGDRRGAEEAARNARESAKQMPHGLQDAVRR